MTPIPARACLPVALLLITAAIAPVRAQHGDDAGDRGGRLDTTVTLSPGGLVALTTRRGDVRVVTGTGNAVIIHANAQWGRIRFDASSRRVALDASDLRGDVRFDVAVPAGVRVSVESQTGDVTVRGTGSDVSVHTRTGDVTVEDASGHVDLNTLAGDITGSDLRDDIRAANVSGEIKLTGLTGNVSATSVSGNVVLSRVTSQSVTGRSTSGDIAFDGAIAADGRYELASHAGDITLTIPADASAQLTVSTWSGSIDSAFPITLEPGDHAIGIGTSKRFTFTIGGGAARISAESFSGDVIIRRRAGR
jgi:Toastrack DUF4097